MKIKLNALLSRALIIFLPGLLYATSALSEPLAKKYGENGDYEADAEFIGITGEAIGSGLVIRYPEGNHGPAPTIIFMNGFGAGGFFTPPLGDTVYEELTKHFVSRGYNVIVPVVTADFNLVTIVAYPKFANRVLWWETQRGLERLADLGRLDKSKIGVMGHSLGGGQTPFITRKLAEHGYGGEGLFMAQLAPWFSHDMNDKELRNLPEHTKYLGIVWKNDDINSFRFAIDIHEHLDLADSEKDFLYYNCGDHFTAGASAGTDNDDDYFFWRHLDALAHYSFEGPNASDGAEFAREVSLGVSPSGAINRTPQVGVGVFDTDCEATGTDDPTSYGFDEEHNQEQPLMSKWHGSLTPLGIPITPFPIGPLLNERWYEWKDYYQYGEKNNNLLHWAAYSARWVDGDVNGLEWFARILDNLAEGQAPGSLYQGKVLFDFEAEVELPRVCIILCYGPVEFDILKLRVTLDKFDIEQGDLELADIADQYDGAWLAQAVDFFFQDIEVALKFESYLLGLSEIVEIILDVLGLDKYLDALDGNFTLTVIKIEHITLPFDVVVDRDKDNNFHTSIMPSLDGSRFKTNIDLPREFDRFGFGLVGEIVKEVEKRLNAMRDFILEKFFEAINKTLLKPLIDAVDGNNSVTMERVKVLPQRPLVCVKPYGLYFDFVNGKFVKKYRFCLKWEEELPPLPPKQDTTPPNPGVDPKTCSVEIKENKGIPVPVVKCKPGVDPKTCRVEIKENNGILVPVVKCKPVVVPKTSPSKP